MAHHDFAAAVDIRILDADFDAVTDRFIAACAAMRRDGWWDGVLTNRQIKRRILREMWAARTGLFRDRAVAEPKTGYRLSSPS